MSWSDWEGQYSKAEPSPLDGFKNKNRLLKSFGPAAIRAYEAMDGKRSARQVQTNCGLGESEFSQFMEFMLQNGPMVSRSGIISSAPRPRAGGADPLDAPSPSLSPLEKIIFDKYGSVGVKVYALIDGEKTAEDILNETGLSESKLVEILEFMNEQGIIKLERPAGKTPPPYGAAPGRPGTPPASRPPLGSSSSGDYRPGARSAPSLSPDSSSSRSSGDNVGFKPMVESETPESQSDVISPDAVPVDVPVMPGKANFWQKARMRGLMSLKFGQRGDELLTHLDGEKDFVELSAETGLTFKDLDIMLGELGRAGMLSFKRLTRAEIRHRYGDDGLAIFKRYGRDGLLIYDLIGKVSSLKEIAKRTRLEAHRAVEIIIFVHQVLGLELPLDKEMIYRYLTSKG
ncbi:MAG: hypothetical protein V1728_01705 [Candidatus Micrarchaeota archaeon]